MMTDFPGGYQGFRHRRSTRMKGYDYSSAGAYFITINTYKKSSIFGEVENGELVLSPFGQIASKQWSLLEERFHLIGYTTHIIMPDHVHGIICRSRGAGEESNLQTDQIPPLRPYKSPGPIPGSLGAIIRAYKSSVTFRINALRGSTLPPIWQRNYYDRVIRSEKEYQDIWNYIEANPANNIDDYLNSAAVHPKE